MEARGGNFGASAGPGASYTPSTRELETEVRRILCEFLFRVPSILLQASSSSSLSRSPLVELNVCFWSLRFHSSFALFIMDAAGIPCFLLPGLLRSHSCPCCAVCQHVPGLFWPLGSPRNRRCSSAPQGSPDASSRPAHTATPCRGASRPWLLPLPSAPPRLRGLHRRRQERSLLSPKTPVPGLVSWLSWLLLKLCPCCFMVSPFQRKVSVGNMACGLGSGGSPWPCEAWPCK